MSQYQHFIPKFILRKWGEYVEPLNDGSKSDAAWENAKKRAQRKAGVSALAMKNGFANMVLERRNCGYICGLNNMPENADDLFILTQNAFGVFEGPMSSLSWTSWHFFCPIGPKLLILMRHNDLTPSFEESWARNLHEATVNLNPVIHANPGMVMSWFRDMPVYRSGSPDMFKHFIISSEYVQCINSILLDNASDTTMIIFRNEASLVRALEVFPSSEKRGLKLLVPLREQHNASLTVKASGEQIAKIAVGGHYGYEEYLQGLETVAASLGSNVRLRRTELTSRIALSPRFSEEFVTRYRKLGWDGTDSVWLKDLERATEILTDGVFSDMVQQMRDTVYGTEYALNIFRQRTKSSDRRQVWLSNRLWGAIEHFKIPEKITMLQHLDEVVSDDFWCWGDRIADVCDMFPQDLTSNFLFLTLEVRRAWKRLMSEYPLSGLRPQYHFDLAFSEIGSICNCGMQLVSQQAIAARNSLDARTLEQILRRTVDFDLDDDMSTETQDSISYSPRAWIRPGSKCRAIAVSSGIIWQNGVTAFNLLDARISELVTAITSAVFTLDDQLRWYEKKIPMPSRHAEPSMLTLSSFIDASANACYNLTS
ncbi:hypothetical protein M409DRAFT_56803 [Zasmidium cellare ATCC 36951]|uniref:DUF4238 domain-containing protein n=1 Tax=Zasmidium cellare ATCC 36951 TaxID=1080233 RepID=A0A6A6CBB2_ZASCE|nr:uncharacterized protein M409DRAFT_56803 [Zasmidium cellare ATCC 36951]KAF2164083.1 hypothetical protein M409DRAFT_56803 [Zasmidium cellare ATCC 36951]